MLALFVNVLRGLEGSIDGRKERGGAHILNALVVSF